MKQNKRYGLLFILIILMFTVSDALASGRNTNYKIEYLNNKLSVNAEKAPLGSVLAIIQEKTEVEFLLNKEESDRIISVRFQSLPIERALERILNKLNYAVIFGHENKIQKVIIYGRSTISLTPHIHKGNMSSSSNTATIEAPGEEGMKINQSPDNRTPDGMKIFYSPDNRTPDGMKIFQSPDNRTLDGMKIFHPQDIVKIPQPP